eukprot:CAMPEP_0197825386 /NCGR_PEP_ID=MMETSP1437-20131217/2481_1 /TAXON_ID=49252 ORGANISM="Eucampia antarctica, Strain CCMP1452" /NCGR_SAMPLE_ID=MMETSP1437 /ASSEMBLY_ACC=CAM_ASM_001096 /LENGTH=219 /DNA_ID=CAMNT_0043425367 /DNA_START=90 /DNA_END=749 /DNA_ORIENTATION=-
MAPLRTLAALVLSAGVASGFAPATPFTTKNSVSSPSNLNLIKDSVFEDATVEWSEEYAPFAKFGWGPSVQAEKWNGRHAMFGWVMLCATAYAKGHGLIPDADVPLDFKEWGTLATISNKDTITHERAFILMANVHAFMVGLCATIAPLPFWDPLLLEEGQVDAEPYGVMPAMKGGVTPECEMLNGRMAMLGIVTLIGYSATSGKDMLDIVNEWVGGLYY